MPGQRGVARRTTPRRRTTRTRIKSGYPVYVRRFKKLNFLITDLMPMELDWELTVLDLLEQKTYAELLLRGIPEDQWQYYMGFQKRLWERYVHFQQATFMLEKTSLITEYTLRGLNPVVLAALQGIAESMAEYKITGIPPPEVVPPAWAYDATRAQIYLMEPIYSQGGGYDNRGSGSISIWEPQGSNGGGYDNRQ